MFGKKREHLIPIKDSKRVIRLEERGHRLAFVLLL